MHGALLVATGVPDADDFDRCRALGFTYFQGDFFAKPRMVAPSRRGHRRASARCARSAS